MPSIYQSILQYKAALLRREKVAAMHLVAAYGLAYRRLSAQQKKLLEQIEEAKEAGELVNQSWLLRNRRYLALLIQVREEIGKFADTTEKVVTTGQRQAISQAIDDQKKIFALVDVQFNQVNKSAVENMVGSLADGSPLKSLLNELPVEASQIVEEGLIQGIIQGRNPTAVAREIRQGLNGNLTRALKISRTEMTRAYRETAHQTYNQNTDVVEGWIWVASKSERTCNACLALDGTFHPVSEPMASHVNCRCVAAPAIRGREIDYKTGSEWFDDQDAATQREMLGSEEAYQAYKRGDLELEDYVGKRESQQWGKQYFALSPGRALAGEGRMPE
jgi:SPP1 gp7 family putative phage head morphogenesis protein